MFDKNLIKAILFDMDGTLIDTEPVGMRVMKEVVNTKILQLSKEDWIFFDKVWRRDGTDISFENFCEQIFKSNKLEIGVEKFISDFYKKYEEAIVEAPALSGADELLKDIAGKYAVALVTASTQSQAQAILAKNGWDDYFDLVITEDEFKIKKPDPAGYLMAAVRLNVVPKQCLVVEDSANGTLAGKNAGMHVIGVREGNEHLQDLSAADEIYSTLSEIIPLLA